jgi:uncharacterized protein YfaQ (DUF2300 family)
MRQVVVGAAALLASWTAGLIAAALVVPGVSVSVAGCVVAVVVFTIAQTILSLWISKLPHGYASLLLGSSGLILTFVAMSLAAVLTGGLSIGGFAPWVATGAVVWLATTIGAILLPEVYGRRPATSA